MNWVTALAIYFIIWWVVLFTVLPIGVRSQVENDDVTLGTERGAPAKPMIVRKMLLTSVVSLAVFAAFYWAVYVMGFGLDDIPRIVPQFSKV